MRPKVLTIALKESRHILRDPRTLAIVFLIPVMMLLLYGYAVNLDLRNIPLAVVDRDHSPLSRLLVERMVESGYFEVVARPQELAPAERLVMAGRAMGILVIPRNFLAEARRDRGARVQLLLDGTDANSANIAMNYFELFVRELAGPLRPAFELRPRVLYNPQLESVNFIVPGLAAIIMMLICALMTSVTIVREKETGTLELVLTTPIRPYQVILGKVLPYIAIAYIEGLLIVGLSYFWFEVPLNGSLGLLLFMTLGYVFATLSIGIAISAATATQQVAMSLALVGTLLPSVLLSGFIFPVTSMPLPLQVVNRLIPATYYIRILRGIMLKGVGWEVLWPDFLTLVGMGLLLLGVGMKKFSTRLS